MHNIFLQSFKIDPYNSFFFIECVSTNFHCPLFNVLVRNIKQIVHTLEMLNRIMSK